MVLAQNLYFVAYEIKPEGYRQLFLTRLNNNVFIWLSIV